MSDLWLYSDARVSETKGKRRWLGQYEVTAAWVAERPGTVNGSVVRVARGVTSLTGRPEFERCRDVAMAELLAVEVALYEVRVAVPDATRLVVHSDASMVVESIGGRAKPKVKYREVVARIIDAAQRGFTSTTFVWVPRSHNRSADWLCRVGEKRGTRGVRP